MTTAPDLRDLVVKVPARVRTRIEKLADAAKISAQQYGSALLMAAYTARVTDRTGDRDLDAAVSRIVILDALTDTPAEEIAAYVGLSADTVRQVLKKWRDEQAGCRPAAQAAE